MFTLLLALIYLAFISLGLPDSLLGSAWPVMRVALDVPSHFAGIISMIIAGGTIVSSLLSDLMTHKLGAARVTAFSVGTTALALWGFSVSDSLGALCLWAVPYGLGAGAVDAALNNYVALHYAARHMSWLHGFWGVGASVSPYIMGAALA
ncbi:MAG TPA: MFS transporter, partial [Clostridia bacterium]|nr:MFS transporter [Clostridia bacterium]